MQENVLREFTACSGLEAWMAVDSWFADFSARFVTMGSIVVRVTSYLAGNVPWTPKEFAT
jgi:hypothetical protein